MTKRAQYPLPMTKRKLAKISDIEDIVNLSKNALYMRQLNVIKEWKEGKVADVDVYGCDRLAEGGVEPKVK